MRKSISLALWMTVAACAQQPRPAPIAPKSLSYEEHRRRHPDRYIETVEGQHAADCQRLEGAGLAKDYEIVRMAVDRYLPTTHHPLYATGETPEIARRLHVEQTTLWLVNTGYRAVDVTDPWGAERLVRLAAGPFDENKSRAAQLARTVALAEFVDVLTEPGKPGIRRFSTVRYRIVEPLKNAPPAGTLIRVPGGPTINPDETSAVSTADLEMVRPGRYILYVSQLKVAAFAPRTTPVDLYGNVFGPLREADKLFVPVGESSHPEVTLEDIRGAIREQLCLENHLLISTGNNPPHRC